MNEFFSSLISSQSSIFIKQMNNLDILQEVTERLPNETLESLSHTSLWNSIKSFSQDQLWWYHRTEYLVGRSLKPQIGNWATAYKSLSEDGLSFKTYQDYGSPLVISILLEIGADPTPYSERITRQINIHQNIEVLKLLLDDGRFDPTSLNYSLLKSACSRGSLEIVDLVLSEPIANPSTAVGQGCLNIALLRDYPDITRLLLSSSKIDPSSDDNSVLLQAIRQGDPEIVRLIIADDRVDPSLEDNEAIKLASENGFTEIVRLLLAYVNVDSSVDDDYSLRKAVENNHIDVVRLILKDRSGTDIEDMQGKLNISLARACKFGSLEMVELLLSNGADPTAEDNQALRVARRFKRREIEEVLLGR